MNISSNKPRPVGELLESLLRSWGLDQASREVKVFDCWAEVVGEEMAGNTRPIAVHRGRLVVAVRDNAWMQELQFMKEDLKKRLNRELGRGVIKEIHFKLRSWEEDPEAGQEAAEENMEIPGCVDYESELPRETVDEARRAVAVIKDPVVRKQVYRALLASAWREAKSRPE